MTATNHTEHYGLSQYTEDDRPTYTGDYNGDMSKIDAAIYAASQSGGTSGLTEVAHTADLTGDGTADSPLGVADTIARTEDIPSLDGYATTESVTQAIAAAIADRLTAGDIKPGNGINIETSGNQVTISYVGGGSAGGLSAVAHDDTLTGDGTQLSPLGLQTVSIEKGGTGATSYKEAAWRILLNNKDWPSNSPSFSDASKILCGAGFSTNNEPIYPRSALTLWTYIKNKIDTTYTILQSVSHDGTLTGDGTASSPLSVVGGGGSSGGGLSSVSVTTPLKGNGTPGDPLTIDLSRYGELTSRIETLESTVSQLTAAATPSATGLTATQLDTQYSDDYNIVRVGTPTRNTESEETSHE